MYPDDTPDELQSRQEYRQFVAETLNYLLEIVTEEEFHEDETPSAHELFEEADAYLDDFVQTMDEIQYYHPHLWVDILWYGTEPQDWSERLYIDPEDSARHILQDMAYEVFTTDLRQKLRDELDY